MRCVEGVRQLAIAQFQVMGIMGIRVFVVDDHIVALDGLKNQLQLAGLVVVGSAPGGLEAIESLQSVEIDVLVLDIRMSELDGLATLERVRATNPKLPAVMLSSYENPTYIARAVALGACEYVLKSAGGAVLVAAISRAHHGETSPPDSTLSRVSQVMRREVNLDSLPKDMPLTGREAQVLKHMALGLSNKEIAQSLMISVETIKEHVQNILRKVNAKDRTDAAVRAIRVGLVEL